MWLLFPEGGFFLFLNTWKVWLIQIRFSMLYLVLQMCLVLKLWFTVFWGEYVYKKIPGNPYALLSQFFFQTQSILTLYRALSIPVALLLPLSRNPWIPVARGWETNLLLLFWRANFLKFIEVFDLFLRVKYVVPLTSQESGIPTQQTNFILYNAYTRSTQITHEYALSQHTWAFTQDVNQSWDKHTYMCKCTIDSKLF